MRVAVIFHHFGPYHFARLLAAARHVQLTAIEVAGQTDENAWSQLPQSTDYRRVTLFPTGDSRVMPSATVSHAVGRILDDIKPDALAIPGWSDNAALAALRWCAQARVPAILMSESTRHDEPRVIWREWIKRRIVDLYSTALVGGQRHIDYLVNLGMPRERIFTGYDVVDSAYFAEKAREARSQRANLRSQFRLPENYFLASARFIPKKNLLTLIRAYGRYYQGARSSPWDMVLLGDGPLKPDICRLISELQLESRVHLPGFKQYDELPVYYALANAFVHASTSEQWGLVVNEALASGLPVIVSNRCGCVPELVQDNGFTFDPSNQDDLTQRMFEIALLPEDEWARLATASERIASNFGPERFGDGLARAAKLALDLPRNSPGVFDRMLLAAVMRRSA